MKKRTAPYLKLNLPSKQEVESINSIGNLYFVFPGNLETQTGGYHYDRRIISELRESGINVELIALPESRRLSQEDSIQSVKKIFSALPDRSLVIVDGLAFGVLDEIAVAEAKRLKLVALCHHPLALETGLNEPQKQTLHKSEQRAMSYARAIVITSEHTRKILAKQFAVPEEKMTVALPGTDSVPFAACEGDPLRLLTVASLIPRKAHDVLIDALAQIRHLEWHARFIGSCEFNPGWALNLENQVDLFDLRQRITFIDSVDSIQDEYQHADLFVLPSHFEGYGMVFAEALAAGLPIVAARAGAVPDVVPESAGILVPPGDSETLSSALSDLITNNDRRKKLQEGAQKTAASLPTWKESAQVIAQKLTEVVLA